MYKIMKVKFTSEQMDDLIFCTNYWNKQGATRELLRWYFDSSNENARRGNGYFCIHVISDVFAVIIACVEKTVEMDRENTYWSSLLTVCNEKMAIGRED